MSKRNPGGLISTTGLREPSATDQSKNSGVWTLEEQYQADARGTWSNQTGQTYQISNSLRFRASAVTTLTKTFSSTSTGNSKVFTYSFWVKKGLHNANMQIFSSAGPNHPGGADLSTIVFNQDEIQFYHYPNGGSGYWLVKSHPMRDHSAWYHVVLSCDTNNSVDKLRARMWINGVEHVKSDNVYPSLNASTYYFSTRQQMWGQEDGRYRYPFDGYLAELHAIDGQQLDASYFGYFDHNDVWQPKPYTGKYGINGYYFPFYPGSNINLADNYGNSSNYALQSETFDSGTWQKPAAPVAPTVTANSVVAPDGRTTADTLNFSTTNTHPVYQTISLSVPRDLGVITGSVYLKQNTANLPVLFQVSLFNSGSVIIDGYGLLTFTSTQPSISNFAGSAGSHINARYENVGNGWYRVIVTAKNTTATTCNEVRISVGAYGQAGSVYAWGAMLNYGYQPGDYKATTTSAINNNWTPTQFGAADCVKDSPTDGNTLEDTGLGGQVSGNYATWNPLVGANYNNVGSLGGTIITFSDGNLSANNSANTGFAPRMQCWSTIGMTSGKWYAEFTNLSNMGVNVSKGPIITGTGNGIDTIATYSASGSFFVGNGATGTQFGTAVSCTTSDIIGVAFDVDAATITWYKNGVQMGGFTNLSASNSIYESSRPWFFGRSPDSSGSNATMTANFGQQPFAYAAPAGFKCLTTANLPQSSVPNGKKYFDTVLYRAATSNGIYRVDGLDFRPDFTWIKNRDNVERHLLTDVVRGNVGVTDKFLVTSDTSAEGANGVSGTTFSVTDTGYEFNETSIGVGELYFSGRSYVGWNWKRGVTPGLDIMTYTGSLTTTGSLAINHNLGVAPKLIISKSRNPNGADGGGWNVQVPVMGADKFLFLNTTQSLLDSVSTGGGPRPIPTSTQFYTTWNSGSNVSGNNYVAYLFAEIPGFSNFGKYYGTGSTEGAIIYTGFRPKFILVKAVSNSTTSTVWTIFDTQRSKYNASVSELYPNLTNSEGTDTDGIDILSYGFRPKRNSEYANYVGWTYIYAAFAEHPFKNARAR